MSCFEEDDLLDFIESEEKRPAQDEEDEGEYDDDEAAR